MSEEQLKAFLEAVKADAGLQEKLKAAGDADADAVIAIAKAAGFAISADELKKAQSEISEEELACVRGGSAWVVPRGMNAEEYFYQNLKANGLTVTCNYDPKSGKSC